jgi:hypothetical protein
MNSIKNNPVTTEDVEIAEKIFGPDIPSLKGKTTRRKPVPVVEDYIDIPKELVSAQRSVTLCIDVMKVNGVPFLTTISKNIHNRTAQYVKGQTSDVYRTCLSQVLRIYKMGGFRVEHAQCDNEFRPLMDTLANDFGVKMNYVNPQEHVPEAERNNRTIKECICASYHRIPFKCLPRLMIKVLVADSAQKLNFFLAKDGISEYYSPRMILHQRNIDYDKHCLYSFGTYVQAHDEPDKSNTTAPRTLDCIYLRYNDNEQGGHDLFHLQTNRLITRRQVTPVPITSSIIQQVDRIAEMDGMPKGLKITNRTSKVLYDSTWIAGVDYDEDSDEESDYEEESDDSDNDNDYIPGLVQHHDSDSKSDSDDDSEDDDDEDDRDELDANEIAELADPIALQQNNDQQDVDDDKEEEEVDEDDEEEEEVEEDDDDTNPTTVYQPHAPVQMTRSGRVVKPRDVYTLQQCHLQAKPNQEEEYSLETTRVIATTICHMNLTMGTLSEEEAFQFIQTYSLKAGLKKFGERGKEAATSEMKQLQERAVFEPIRVEEMTQLERKRAMESLIFLVEKRDGRIKARTCANGSTQRAYTEREEAAIPTAMTESILYRSDRCEGTT